MLFHTMVGSNNIERSKRFYDKVLSVLGVSEATLNIAGSGHTRLFYRNENGTNFIVTEPINDEPATVANGSTVAFTCNSPEQVKEFHDVAIANGGTSVEAPPGPRMSPSMGPIELAYFRDPDGNKLCGIHFPT
ncbi:glyoxalase [Sphingomonas sp. Leaf231]|uniref:VOC family protein n=1 Tax=Sphingomonas sp. Leaf231 TaxID=1736301 RepID=UPI0006F9811B|nr:VOC family protein [Sphingomonas sp. Leaf231]KQN90092.1 glyoxalase [Sphingomonas sp. Leaf231]